ncbi:MAG: hypothetical protein IPO60_01445 [Flavobacteriales bacterium]|nr:hypothetical protein [Flavobacteriales bacterium]
MKRRELRKAAAAKIAMGYSRQHAYDALRVEEPTADNEDLANAVRFTPSLMAREHFKNERNILVVLVVALSVFYFWQVGMLYQDQGSLRLLFYFALPLALLFLGVTSANNRNRPYSGIALLAFITGTHWWNRKHNLDIADPRTMVWLVLTVAVIALALYLHNKLTSDYTMQRDPREGMHKRAVFPPEPGSLV